MKACVLTLFAALLLAAPVYGQGKADCGRMLAAIEAAQDAASQSMSVMVGAAMLAEGMSPAALQRIAARLGNPLALIEWGGKDMLLKALKVADTRDAALKAVGCPPKKS
jgi:hypothetical protein